MLVACYAYEGMFQGLHGINSVELLEVDEENLHREIKEWGLEASDSLIVEFGLEDDYLSELADWDSDLDKDDDEAWEEFCDTADYTEAPSYSDRGWSAHKVRDDVTLSKKELDQELAAHEYGAFVLLYCEKEDLA